jgi:hypothetical protein
VVAHPPWKNITPVKTIKIMNLEVKEREMLISFIGKVEILLLVYFSALRIIANRLITGNIKELRSKVGFFNNTENL